ncbi:hypothetical protein [Konateibacter massiliensis]|uniref:hypothetical protein n=1 Tax=Konateibacter massiliensis TaxID=2002841 RepID=UPI000C157F24|nr:hypothetical protein [Konateibacter massiliensis]
MIIKMSIEKYEESFEELRNKIKSFNTDNYMFDLQLSDKKIFGNVSSCFELIIKTPVVKEVERIELEFMYEDVDSYIYRFEPIVKNGLIDEALLGLMSYIVEYTK